MPFRDRAPPRSAYRIRSCHAKEPRQRQPPITPLIFTHTVAIDRAPMSALLIEDSATRCFSFQKTSRRSSTEQAEEMAHSEAHTRGGGDTSELPASTTAMRHYGADIISPRRVLAANKYHAALIDDDCAVTVIRASFARARRRYFGRWDAVIAGMASPASRRHGRVIKLRRRQK